MVDPADFDYDIFGYASLDVWLIYQENRQILSVVWSAGLPTGAWVASFDGFDSPALAPAATPLEVEIALNAIPSIARRGGCAVSGVAGVYYLVDWKGDLANDVQELIVTTNTFAPVGSVTADYTTADLTGCTAKSTIRTTAGAELLTMDTAGGRILLGGNGPILDGSAEPAPTLGSSSTGGALAAGTYYVRTTWTTPYGESLPSGEGTITLTGGGTHTITVTTAALPTGAQGIRVYLALDPSHAGRLVGEINGITLTVGTLPPVSAGAAPATDTSAGVRGLIRLFVPASATGATLVAAGWPANWKAATDFHLTRPTAPPTTEVLFTGTVTYHPAATQ